MDINKLKDQLDNVQNFKLIVDLFSAMHGINLGPNDFPKGDFPSFLDLISAIHKAKAVCEQEIQKMNKAIEALVKITDKQGDVKC